eukprot:CAMPEP_0170119906 /NCGR_PEP_ID=MMETSP0020_2-20130122/14745_1 /TAXON_ID=98059 /ORGANISM="Dinobryon sp., Strain UTEXLB2267" /LENGTH=76 /DNA_ID=CAMNT_0010349507 /DNA_START=204 /DNA_END=434 /DNA_ORIENTATION=-
MVGGGGKLVLTGKLVFFSSEAGEVGGDLSDGLAKGVLELEEAAAGMGDATPAGRGAAGDGEVDGVAAEEGADDGVT